MSRREVERITWKQESRQRDSRTGRLTLKSPDRRELTYGCHGTDADVSLTTAGSLALKALASKQNNSTI